MTTGQKWEKDKTSARAAWGNPTKKMLLYAAGDVLAVKRVHHAVMEASGATEPATEESATLRAELMEKAKAVSAEFSKLRTPKTA
mgnify:CR=1 FL=1